MPHRSVCLCFGCPIAFKFPSGVGSHQSLENRINTSITKEILHVINLKLHNQKVKTKQCLNPSMNNEPLAQHGSLDVKREVTQISLPNGTLFSVNE